MTKYRELVSFDGKQYFWIVIDNDGSVINNPTKDELRGTKIKSYNRTNTCPRCREESELTDKSILYPRNALRDTDRNGKKTKEWVCNRHGCSNYQRYDINSQYNTKKSLSDRRTKNQDPNSTCVKGDNSQELACKLYGWKDLNKRNDNYTRGTPLDCYDPMTGLYHQVQGRYYNYIYELWKFTNFEGEWKKEFENMVCFCFSEDGKIIERIYKFPLVEIKRVKGVAICKSLTYKGCGWYEKYRVKNEDELKKANEIWTHILKE